MDEISPASQFRRDPICGHWSVVAAGRLERPLDFVQTPPVVRGGSCPFCAGHEVETPQAILVVPQASAANTADDWQVRVVPNKYPAVRWPETGAAPPEVEMPVAPLAGEWSEPGYGAHEVIIESPRHVRCTTELTSIELATVLATYQQRLQTHAANANLSHATIFKNLGPQAGASLEHLHSQLVATPGVPPQAASRLAASAAYWRQRSACIFCDTLAGELALGVRVAAESANFVAICPYASRFAYEVWVLPRQHLARFDATPAEWLEELATLLLAVLEPLENRLSTIAYNYVVQSATFDSFAGEHYHWHIEIFPRLGMIAGYEWGSGCYINPVSPESAAEFFRGSC